MKAYRVYKRLKSGGAVGTGLDEDGNPCYALRKDDEVSFVKSENAHRFMELCKSKLPFYPGQLDYEVLGVDV